VHIAIAKNPNKRSWFPVLFWLLLLIAVSTIAYTLVARRTVPAQPVKISQAMLEQKYGLRMDLVAVTAAGGFVDVRIRMVDGEKAKSLLSEKSNFPVLAVGKHVILQAPNNVKSQELRFENNGTMFIMYANSGGAVQPGTPVTVLFGDITIDPIEAR
jgi:hypothetical protein